MPFGLKNAPATFQRLMDQVLTGLQGTELFVYLDDIVIYASSLQEHGVKIRNLLNRLKEHGLTLQPDKCEFLRKEVTYLGHIITSNGVRPDPSKLTAVRNFPVPKNAKHIKQFLGLAGYYRRIIPDFSKIAKPMTDLLKKDVKFSWATKQQDSFENLKEKLCNEPILQFPNFNEPFVVTTDVSDYAVGAILSQGKIGQDLPIAYASRTLNSAERNYSTTEKECLAIIYAVAYFRPYLYGRKFVLVTDHRPLVWLHSVKDPSSRLMRWKLKLADFEYSVIYKSGKTNLNADALSRNPVASSLVNLFHRNFRHNYNDSSSETDTDDIKFRSDIRKPKKYFRKRSTVNSLPILPYEKDPEYKPPQHIARQAILSPTRTRRQLAPVTYRESSSSAIETEAEDNDNESRNEKSMLPFLSTEKTLEDPSEPKEDDPDQTISQSNPNNSIDETTDLSREQRIKENHERFSQVSQDSRTIEISSNSETSDEDDIDIDLPSMSPLDSEPLVPENDKSEVLVPSEENQSEPYGLETIHDLTLEQAKERLKEVSQQLDDS